MSREKQIEEMAKICCKVCEYEVGGKCTNEFCEIGNCCIAKGVARKLYNAGYRKQSEGEWKKFQELYPRYVCTACNHLFNNKSYKYCPNCGAKMKGGAE